MSSTTPPAIRAGSGADVFTERLVAGLRRRGLHAEISWLPHRTEYAPWTLARLTTPACPTTAQVNTGCPGDSYQRNFRTKSIGMPIVKALDRFAA